MIEVNQIAGDVGVKAAPRVTVMRSRKPPPVKNALGRGLLGKPLYAMWKRFAPDKRPALTKHLLKDDAEQDALPKRSG